MKILFTSLLLLLSLSGFALSRQSPTPVLHSVLDAKPAPPVHFFMMNAGQPVPQPFGPERKVRIQTRAEHDQRVGMGLIIGGAALSGLGTVLLLALMAEDGYRFPDGAFGLDGFVTFLFALMIAGGIGMIIPGVIRHSRAIHHSDI